MCPRWLRLCVLDGCVWVSQMVVCTQMIVCVPLDGHVYIYDCMCLARCEYPNGCVYARMAVYILENLCPQMVVFPGQHGGGGDSALQDPWGAKQVFSVLQEGLHRSPGLSGPLCWTFPLGRSDSMFNDQSQCSV